MAAEQNPGPSGEAGPDEDARLSAAVDAESFEAAGDAQHHPDPPGPNRIAVIFAHPDDAEFICAGAVARWVAEGHHVTYVLLTSGDKGSDDPAVTPEALAATRMTEQRAACAVLGVQEIRFLGYADAMLVPDLAMRKELVRVIRTIRPDVVVCQDPTVRFVGQNYLNHPDHRAAGEATLDAVYPAARDRMTFPELLTEGLEPHKVREVYLAGANAPDLAIDITATMETKLAALRCHASQMGEWDPEPEIRKWATEDAARFPDHGEYVETFKYFKLD